MSNPIQNNINHQSSNQTFIANNDVPMSPIASATNAIALTQAKNSQQSIGNRNFTFANIRNSSAGAPEVLQSAPSFRSTQTNKSQPFKLFALPNSILEKIIEMSGTKVSTLKQTSQQFRNLTNIAMEGFWLSNFEDFTQTEGNPETKEIRNHIRQLRIAEGSNNWQTVNPDQKLRKLYCKMVEYVRNIDPVRLKRLSIQDRILDFSLYQELAKIPSINLQHCVNAILQRMPQIPLPQIDNVTLSQLQEIISNPTIIGNTRWLMLDGVTDITALPPEIQQLVNLDILSVTRTSINALPNNLSLPDLFSLKLDNTQISTLPNTINLPNLHELSLSNTQISAWPHNLNLPCLQSLSLNDTPMTTLPHNLPNLGTLDLENSQIATLPENPHSRLPALVNLSVGGTPLVQTEKGKALALDWGRRHNVEVIF